MKNCDWCKKVIDPLTDSAYQLHNFEDEIVCDACHNEFLVFGGPNPYSKACDYCGVVTPVHELVQHNDDGQYCPTCHKEQTLMEMVAQVTYATMRVNMNSKFCAYVHYAGSVNTLEVTLAPSKEDYNTFIAHSYVRLDADYKDPMKELETIHRTLMEIAITNQLPNLRPYYNNVYQYEVMAVVS